MSWLDQLKGLREKIAGNYVQRMAEVATRRGRLDRFANELDVENMLAQMNEVLLGGGARLIVNRSWQYEFEDDDPDEDDEPGDKIIYVLYWHDGAPVEIEVRVGIDQDEAGYVMVDDEEVEDTPEAIQSALIESFGEIAELDD